MYIGLHEKYSFFLLYSVIHKDGLNFVHLYFLNYTRYVNDRPPLWSSGQCFWLQIQRSRVRSPALPDFLSSSGSGTGSTQPREVKLRSYLNKKSSGYRFRKQRLTAVGTRCANHVTPLYPQKVGTNFAYRRRPLCRYGSLAD